MILAKGNLYQTAYFGLKVKTKQLKGLYGITSQNMLLDNAVMFTLVELALKGGMSILQYRNKHTPAHQSIEDLLQLKQLCHDYHCLFIINDDVSLCRELKADGVHLGKDDDNVIMTRKRLGQDSIIGVSCYNDLSIAQQAVEQGADYIAFGAFFNSPTKPNAPEAKPELISQAKKLNTPICCIGGITAQNATPLIKEGANMIAVISELFNKPSIEQQAKQFKTLF